MVSQGPGGAQTGSRGPVMGAEQAGQERMQSLRGV